MSDEAPVNPPNLAAVRTELHEVAQLLRGTSHLDPAVQKELADLLDELSQAVQAHTPPAEILHLAQTATQLAHQLHRPENRTPTEGARERLRQAVTRAETAAPRAAQVAGRLIDALANLGI
jgi:hypothetical protein